MGFDTSFSKILSEEVSLFFRNTFESVRGVAARRLEVRKRESVGLVWRLDFTSPSFRYIQLCFLLIDFNNCKLIRDATTFLSLSELNVISISYSKFINRALAVRLEPNPCRVHFLYNQNLSICSQENSQTITFKEFKPNIYLVVELLKYIKARQRFCRQLVTDVGSVSFC